MLQTLLGAGGAARGVILPLIEENIASLMIVNRTQPRAMELAQQFSHSGVPVSSAAFEQLDQCFDVIINATSASLDSALPPLPDCVFGPETLAYDMMYAAQPTIFMQHAARQGAKVRDGLGMLIEQAAESFLSGAVCAPRQPRCISGCEASYELSRIRKSERIRAWSAVLDHWYSLAAGTAFAGLVFPAYLLVG